MQELFFEYFLCKSLLIISLHVALFFVLISLVMLGKGKVKSYRLYGFSLGIIVLLLLISAVFYCLKSYFVVENLSVEITKQININNIFGIFTSELFLWFLLEYIFPFVLVSLFSLVISELFNLININRDGKFKIFENRRDCFLLFLTVPIIFVFALLPARYILT